MLQQRLNQWICLLLICLSGVHGRLVAAPTTSSGTAIKWMTNYEEALELANKSAKPLVLFFTGSDWCGWCNKLEEEVFDEPEFVRLAGDKYVFLKLDFPLYAAQPAQLNAQNKQLQKKYDIKSYPTLVLIDARDQKQIAATGYRPGGGRQYAQHLQKLVESYAGYQAKLSQLSTGGLSGEELKKLYERAREFDFANDSTYIMKVGMESGAKNYFLLERYRFLAEEGQIHQAEAVALKLQLQAADPDNKQLMHYNMAIIEFEALCQVLHSEGHELTQEQQERIVAPLLQYIANFGRQDKENLWRLEMIVSQVYLDKNQLEDALKHAKASYNAAPMAVQNEIASAIKSMQVQLMAN